jgi:hypothetical protein
VPSAPFFAAVEFASADSRYAVIVRARSMVAALSVAIVPAVAAADGTPYLWPLHGDSRPLASVLEVRPGYERTPASGFGAWLRGLPLRSGKPDVHLYDGSLKANQKAHLYVVDLDVGKRDLQQCADLVIRLRAEYLYASGRRDRICFHFTSGAPAAFARWSDGQRPAIDGDRVGWTKRAAAGDSYGVFRSYLDTVFAYAGTRSLDRELPAVSDPAKPEPGDVFVQGGSPGHAVIVVDVAENETGQRVFAIAQSYMPAQEMHVLRNPDRPESPWYVPRPDGSATTPEWEFPAGSLRRFPEQICR